MLDLTRCPLGAENASIDRIILRIDQTPIQELNRRLKQHLEETYYEKAGFKE